MPDTICSIIRSYFNGEPFVPPVGVDYGAVYDELRVQTISGLAVGCCLGHLLDSRLAGQWQNQDLRRRALIEHLFQIQDQALAVMHSAAIPAVILKGAAAGMYYPDPCVRSYGDIDLMVAKEHLAQAQSLLLAEGFTLGEHACSSDHHVDLHKNGVTLELHWRPNGIPDGDSHLALEDLFVRGLEHIEVHSVAGHDVPTFEPMLNGLVLLLHARQHLAHGGLGFRQLIDWMLFVRRYLDKEGWAEFERLLADERLVHTAKCLSRFCQTYLGLSEHDHEWCLDVDPSVSPALLEHVMLLGNFGRKLTVKTGATVLAGIRNPIELFSSLQRSGRVTWKAAQRYRVLRPLCWAYQACRWARKAIMRPNPLANARFDVLEAARRRRLAEELGLDD